MNDLTTAPEPVARSKFRVPRLRRSSIARAGLVTRLRAACDDALFVSVVAPAGFGKTTLLVQLANSIALPNRVLWMSVDSDDDDPIRFFANLVEALAPLQLQWRESPRDLVRNMAAGGRQARSAIAAMVDALDAAASGRILLIVDDLHRVANTEVFTLLEALVERAPEGFTLLVASRTPPALPVARWRIGGEAAEFGPADLAFTTADTDSLVELSAGHAAADQYVAEVLERTRGWPAGAALMLRSHSHGEGAAPLAASQELLYDYLATEVLEELPAELQEFATEVSILAELTPELCAAVTLRDDARSMLRSLYRQDMFVTAIDTTLPVLRMHDLFRDFLQARLESTAAAKVPTLHERAATAEPSVPRAIGHYIAGGHWQQALALMAANADRLVEQGHRLALQRWLEQVPDEVVAASEQGLYVRGYCAWLRWDWLEARSNMGRLLQRIRENGREPPTRLLLFCSGFASGISAREEAEQLSKEIDARALQPTEQATHLLLRAWRAMDTGDLHAVRDHFAAFVDLAAQDPARICPLIVDRNTAYIGLPGLLWQYERFISIARGLVGSSAAPWHTTFHILDAWVALWRGHRDDAARALAKARELQQRFGGLTPSDDALARAEAIFLAAVGEGERAVRIARPLVERFESPWAASIKVVFERAYWAGVGKVAWMGGDLATVRDVARRLAAPRRPQEWRFIELVRITLQGQLALAEQRWRQAERHFIEAVALHATVRFPQGHVDPRICAAYALVMQGQNDRAWTMLEPVIDECVAEDCIGFLLCEPRDIVVKTLTCIPAARRSDAHVTALLATYEAWHRQRAVPRAVTGPLSRLSDREREVLSQVAKGDGNKDIARRLDLSLHTVKRHIANILDKLDCVSRKQAGELFRQHAN